MKRHTKPYGCTFSKCSKTFGSLNDWKRHENTQHDLDEAWRCEVGRPDNKKCGRMFSKKEDFEAHLNGPHGEDLRNVHLETLINAFHLGRGGHHHFWCGFCDRLIAPPENQDQEKSNPRFKHIGDHFDKEKRNIGDWMDIEANMLKRAMPETNPKYSRNSTMTTESADDSDLGDDGIGIPMTFAHHAQSEYGLEVARQSGFRMYDLDEDEEDGRFKGGIDV